MVVIDQPKSEQGEIMPCRGRLFSLSKDDEEWAWRLIEAGGLTQGGAFAAGTRNGVADGGGTIFEAEIDGVFTYVHAPNLYDGASGARAALRELVRELFASYRDRDDGQEVPLRWVMYGPVAKDVEGVPWPGNEVPEGKPPCVEFEPESVGSEFELLTRNRYYEDMAVSFAGTTYAKQVPSGDVVYE